MAQRHDDEKKSLMTLRSAKRDHRTPKNRPLLVSLVHGHRHPDAETGSKTGFKIEAQPNLSFRLSV